MLKALDERLERLSKDTDDDFHYQIRCRIGKRATGLLEQRLKRLICLMPQLLSRVLDYCEHKEVPLAIRRSIGFILTDLYRPRGFLPEDNQKLFGYLDDAYCVSLVYEMILRHLLKAEVKLDAVDKDFLKQFVLMRRGVKTVIPEEERKISDMVVDVFKSNSNSFYAAFV
mgnify:CR=1 FL=1